MVDRIFRTLLAAGAAFAACAVHPASAALIDGIEFCGRVEALSGREALYRIEKQTAGPDILSIVLCRVDHVCVPTLSFDADTNLAIQWTSEDRLTIKSTTPPVAYQPEGFPPPKTNRVDLQLVDADTFTGAAITNAFDTPGGVFVYGRSACRRPPPPIPPPDAQDD